MVEFLVMCIFVVLFWMFILEDTGNGSKTELKKDNKYLERIAKALERMADNGKTH